MFDFITEVFFTMARIKKAVTSIDPGLQLSINEAIMLQKLRGHEPPGVEGRCPPGFPHDMRVSRSAVSQMMRSLEGKGYITRGINQKDRRRISVEITNSGLEALESLRAFHDETAREVIRRWGQQDAQTLMRLLNRLAAVCEELAAQSGPQNERDK